MSSKFFLFLIIILGLILRLYGINWDGGFHLHPDERMLIMVADRLHFFDQLNPDFFNYGSLPIYLLKGTTQLIDTIFNSHLSNYDGMLYSGRLLSVIFDCITIFLIYKIAQFLEEELIIKTKGLNIKQPQGLFTFKPRFFFPLFSSFFYAIAFFPIQNSHFFISDVFLTTLTTFLIYLLILYFSNGRIKNTWLNFKENFLIGLVFGAMLATKFTAIIFYPITVVIIILAMKQRNNRAINLLTFHFSLFTFHFLFMPYAFIEHQRFLSDILAQIRMNSDPYIFPYTLQYVGTTPYLYYLKNMFWWGLGPVISILSLVGLIQAFRDFRTSCHSRENGNLLDRSRNKFGMTLKCHFLFFIFYLLYFLVIGRSAVKFMRYMLPIYPLLTIMAGFGLYQISNIKNQKYIVNIKYVLLYGLLTLQTLWTLAFVNISSQKHTRIAATEWILKNVPAGSTLAVEHWDDRVPIYGGERYNYVEMTLYERPDDDLKWQGINEKLKQADYIILASNRLYVPLQKLSDCRKYKSCYPKTAEYYRKLFNGKLRFKKVAEFAVYPRFNVGRLTFNIDDQSADESFTVYDHPKVTVFRKIKEIENQGNYLY